MYFSVISRISSVALVPHITSGVPPQKIYIASQSRSRQIGSRAETERLCDGSGCSGNTLVPGEGDGYLASRPVCLVTCAGDSGDGGGDDVGTASAGALLQALRGRHNNNNVTPWGMC